MNVHDDLTFNVIGATMESPSQNPLACLYKPRVCGNKAELLRRNPCPVWLSLSARGWVGGQQAHLSSGPLGFAEGSSTASLFLRSAPRTLHLCLCFCFVNKIIYTHLFRQSSWPRAPFQLSPLGWKSRGLQWSPWLRSSPLCLTLPPN